MRVQVAPKAAPTSPTKYTAGLLHEWRQIPVGGYYYGSFNVVPSTPYYATVWSCDDSYNYAPVKIASGTSPIGVVTPPPKTYTSVPYTVRITDGGSYYRNGGYWKSSNELIYQAGSYDSIGCWFYGDRIRQAVKGATAIEKFTITIQRANTENGVSGAANVRIVPITNMTQPSSGLPKTMATPYLLGTLRRGETKTFNVPTGWYASFLAGVSNGFALTYGNTSFTSPDYMVVYGEGTNSGTLSITVRK